MTGGNPFELDQSSPAIHRDVRSRTGSEFQVPAEDPGPVGDVDFHESHRASRCGRLPR
jgi:hypothetical protein